MPVSRTLEGKRPPGFYRISRPASRGSRLPPLKVQCRLKHTVSKPGTASRGREVGREGHSRRPSLVSPGPWGLKAWLKIPSTHARAQAHSPAPPPTRFHHCDVRLLTSPHVTLTSYWPRGLLGRRRVNSQALRLPGRGRPGSAVSAAPFCRSPSVALHRWVGERASFGPESSSAGVVRTPVFSGPPDSRSLPQSLVLDLYYSFAFFSFRFIFLSAQAGLELAAVILPQSPRCWDYWCAPPRLSLKIFCRVFKL